MVPLTSIKRKVVDLDSSPSNLTPDPHLEGPLYQEVGRNVVLVDTSKVVDVSGPRVEPRQPNLGDP